MMKFNSEPFMASIHRNPYTCQDGLAYTEDGVLVYTMCLPFVRYSHKDFYCFSLVPKDICAYFEKYGPVVSVKLDISKKYGFEYQYALVTMEKAEDACKVLIKPSGHIISGFKIEDLSSADSWEQPFSEEVIRSRRETYNGPINVEESPIFGMNDDCLTHLFSFLYLPDQYKMSKLCERFDNVFESTFRRHYKKINSSHRWDLTLLEWRQILKQYGHLIERFGICGLGGKRRFKEYAPMFCPNLKALTVNESEMSPFSANYFQTVATNLKSLHTVELTNPFVDDNVVLLLSGMDSIECLLLQSKAITGLHLESFQRLAALKIYGCQNLDPLLLIKTFERVQTLTNLDIFHYDAITDEVIRKVVEFCGNLRVFKIDNANCNIEPVSRLANLEKLKISHMANIISDNFFFNLVENLKDKLRKLELNLSVFSLTDVQKECICKLTALEELKIWNKMDDQLLTKMHSLKNLKTFETDLCSSVEVKTIVDFIRNASQLEKLRINCPEMLLTIASDLVLSIIEVLRSKSPKPEIPFRLILVAVHFQPSPDLIEHIMANADVIKVVIYTCA